MNEQLVRRIWLAGGWPTGALRDARGMVMHVVFPGRTGHGAGPDVLDAIIALPSGELVRGDVEFHVRSSDWTRHGHSRDPRYGGVVAHVVWHDDCDLPIGIPGSNGQSTECQLTIALNAVDAPMIFHRLAITPEREQPYHAWFGALSPDDRARFIDGLGDQRLVSHASRLAADWHGLGPDHALYRGMLDALGYSANRTAFAQLSECLPFELVQSVAWTKHDVAEAESAVFLQLLASAGMLDELACARFGAGPGRVAAERCRKAFGTDPPPDRMLPGAWEIVGVRPANRPIRRLAALARLMVRHRSIGFADTVIDAIENEPPRIAVRRLLTAVRVGPAIAERSAFPRVDEPEMVDYWLHRSDFGRLIGGGSVALIGEDRARAILANVLIPFGLVASDDRHASRLADAVRDVWAIAPAPSAHWITSEMRHVAQTVGRGGARREQGIIELYRRCCAERRCLTCPAASASVTASRLP